MNYDDYDGYYGYYDDIDVKDIEHLYELRHATNVLGAKYIASELKINVHRIYQLTRSPLHGSIEIISWIRNEEEEFKNNFEALLQQEIKKQEAIHEAELKNQELIQDLSICRKNFAGIGTNKAKRRLNKLSQSSDIAKAIRLALEIEDKNICAKKTDWRYKDKVYNQKVQLIEELIDIFVKNKWVFGVEKSQNPSTTHVIYFEIPGCEQLSWHFSPSTPKKFPEYDGKWDEKENATLSKLEDITKKILEME